MLYRLRALCWGWRSYRACAGPVGPIDAVRVLKMGLGLLRWGLSCRAGTTASCPGVTKPPTSRCYQSILPVSPSYPLNATNPSPYCHQPNFLVSPTQLFSATNPASRCHQPQNFLVAPTQPPSANNPNLQVPPSHSPSATKPSSQCHQRILPISPTHPCSATNPIS